METAIYSFLQKHTLIQAESTIIVGLSSGPDSVFLIHMLYALKERLDITLIAAYLDHGWRTNTHEDIAFCKELCQNLKILFHHAHISQLGYTPSGKGSAEDEGRTARRFYFEQLAKEHNAHTIALGHHQDDQLETFFIRMIRGASLSGLCGIQPRNGLYIRPLLETSKSDILAYLSHNNISYRNDSSNDSDHFLRNRIRKYLIPTLATVDPRAPSNILKTIRRLHEAHHAMYNSLKEKKETIFFKDTKAVIDIKRLNEIPLFFQKQIISEWILEHTINCILSESLVEEILRFLNSPRGGKHLLYNKWMVVKKSNKAYITNHSY